MIDKVAFLNFLSTAKANGASGSDVAEVIKQASGEEVNPHELEALMASLPQGGHDQHHGGAEQLPPDVQEHGGDPLAGGEGQLPLSEEQINEIAQIVAQHIAQQGQGAEAGLEGLPPEHQQGLDMAKSSEYIGEFIKRASEYGIGVEDSVNIYCTQLSNSIDLLKSAVAHDKEVLKVANEVDEETLAYYQGVAEKASSSNLSYEQTLEVLKQAGADKTLKEKFTNSK